MSRILMRPEGNRHPKNVVIIVAEGETERIFFNSLKQRNSNIEIKSERGKRTNARQLVENCLERIQMNELDISGGDIAICVFDVDNNSQKDLRKAIDVAEKNGIIVALSNPCFELWYLLHFRDIDHHITSREIRSDLSKYITDYDKATDYRELLTPHRKEALVRAKRIAGRRGIKNVIDFMQERNNPCTSIYTAIDAIERLVKRNQSK